MTNYLCQGSTNFICKGTGSKYFGLYNLFTYLLILTYLLTSLIIGSIWSLLQQLNFAGIVQKES